MSNFIEYFGICLSFYFFLLFCLAPAFILYFVNLHADYPLTTSEYHFSSHFNGCVPSLSFSHSLPLSYRKLFMSHYVTTISYPFKAFTHHNPNCCLISTALIFKKKKKQTSLVIPVTSLFPFQVGL